MLREQLGLAPAEQPLFDEAVIAAGGLPEGVSTKPKVTLDPRHPHRRSGGRGADPAAARSPRSTSPARSTTSTPSSSTTCGCRSGARGRSCASSSHVHDRQARTKLRDELKWAQQLTGPVRDLDVQLLEWNELAALLPAGRGPELEPLRALLARRRSGELAEAAARAAQQALRRRARALAEPARGRGAPERRAADRGGGRRADPQGLPAHGQRRQRDRRRQPGRGPARPAQAREGAALPARAVRQPVPEGRGQADDLDAQGPPGGARPLPGPRGADRDAARDPRRARRASRAARRR